MSLYETIKMFFKSGNTKRYHTRRTVIPQDVAQHSYNCALMVFELAHRYNKLRNKKSNGFIRPDICMTHMLIHDIPEHEFGDVPGHIKSRNANIKKAFDDLENKWVKKNLSDWFQESWNGLTYDEEALCKFVDLYECMYKSNQEFDLGNVDDSIEIVDSCLKSIGSLINKIHNSGNNDLYSFLYDVIYDFESNARGKV